MIMPDIPEAAESDNTTDEATQARAFLAFVELANAQKKAPTIVLRKESEAHYFDSLDAPTDGIAYDLLMRAALKDYGNAAAFLDLLEFFDLTLEEEIEATRTIVKIAERRLGKKAFGDCAGHFWTFLETRPYMRARVKLGDLLHEAGLIDLAVVEWQAILDLNPYDDQRIRFALLPEYLRLGNVEKAGLLLTQYADEVNEYGLLAWCKLLERLLLKDLDGAAEALVIARKANGYVEAYLLGHRQPPREVPDDFEMGSREEAVFCANILLDVWDPHTDALKWLFAQPKSSR